MLPALAAADTRTSLASPDGEPLCLPPEPQELCEAARRRLKEVEGDLRRRLSGPDRSVEAIELEDFVSGLRDPGTPGMGTSRAGEDPPAGDSLLDQGVLALCAAHLLGRRAMVHLAESLALRGIQVQRDAMPADQPPRALEAIHAIHRGGHGLSSLAGESNVGDRRRAASSESNGKDPDRVEVCRTPPAGPAARTLLALSAAGLACPVVLIRPLAGSAGSAGPAGPGGVPEEAAFVYAGLGRRLRNIITRAAAPHTAVDAMAALGPLFSALDGRNPWHLYRIAEVPWHNTWTGTHMVYKPQLTPGGLDLATEALGRPPTPDEALALACQALAAAERLFDLTPLTPLTPEPHGPDLDLPSVPGLTDQAHHAVPAQAPEPVGPVEPIEEAERRLVDALRRLTQRPLLPAQDGEAPLFLRAAQRGGLFVVEARPAGHPHHQQELGRLLTPAGTACYARLRLFHFPREAPRALQVTVRAQPQLQDPEGPAGRRPAAWLVDGGDLRVHVELIHGGGLLQGIYQLDRPAG